MKKLIDIKAEKQKKVDALLTECKVFFAFSNQQFEENKTPLAEGEKYISMGAGGYLPKSQAENLNKGFKEIEKWYKEAIKNNKARRALIAYELNNHEAYYTGDISDTLSALGEDFTAAEVMEVYNVERKKVDY